MPRSRRRYQSRSRSRSPRSHSYEREREVKRRRVDSDDASPYRRSVSPEENVEVLENEESSSIETSIQDTTFVDKNCKVLLVDCSNLVTENSHSTEEFDVTDVSVGESKNHSDFNFSTDSDVIELNSTNGEQDFPKPITTSPIKVLKTPLTSSQRKKQLERQQLREAKLAERELKKQQFLEEKLKIKNEKEKEREEKQKIKQEKEEQRLKEKQEKLEQKQKELEEKQKEKELKDEKRKKELEEKEQKRKEKEEREEQKRKEREEKKRVELEEKQKEKQKQEEKKLKVAAIFANFFTKKSDTPTEDKNAVELCTTFMPFTVKTDMRLAKVCRRTLTETEKAALTSDLENSTHKSYLQELKGGKVVGKSGKTWPLKVFENDDVIFIGESVDDTPKTVNIRAKFLMFHENIRPPYFGTWRQKSKLIKPRNPLALDEESLNYTADSADEWDTGSNSGISCSDKEDVGDDLDDEDGGDREEDEENEYEMDDTFVPHGHISDDEIDDVDQKSVESEAAHEAKLTLLQQEFDNDMKDKPRRITPRVLGCIWEKKIETTIDNAILAFLKPFSIIANGPIMIKKRSELIVQMPSRKGAIHGKPLSEELVPTFLKSIHGSTNKMKHLINEFLSELSNKGITTEVTKASLRNESKNFAEWVRYTEEGPMFNTLCWCVPKDMQEKYKLDLKV